MMRLRKSVGDPQPGVLTFVFQVAVFNPVTHFFRRSGSCVRADIRFASDLSAQGNILIGSECIRILYPPGLVKERCSDRPYRFLPVIAGYKAAARPAENRHTNPAHGFQHIRPEPLFVRKRAGWIIDTTIDLAMEMLNKVSVQHFAAPTQRRTGANKNGTCVNCHSIQFRFLS